MPPRYVYWTIIVDDQPTAFRSGSQEELMPTFKRLKAKNDTAVMMWFQNGKLWPSRVDAQEAMLARGELGRPRDAGMGLRDRDRQPRRPALSERRDSKGDRVERTAWTPRGEPSTPPADRNAENKLDWKPKGDFVPAPKRAERPSTYAKTPADRQAFKPSRSEKPDWKPRSDDRGALRSEKPEWKPKGAFTPAARRSEKPDWKPKGSSFAKATADRSFDRDERSDWKSKPSRTEERPRSFKRPDFKPSADDSRPAKPEWKPKGSFVPAPRRSEKPDRNSKTSRPQDLKTSRSERPEWKPKGSFVPAPKRSEKPDWKPKGSSFPKATADRSFDRERKGEWKPKASFERGAKPDWKSRPSRDSGGRFSSPDRERAPRTEKLDWKPKGEGLPAEKRKWVPKEEYKKSMGIEAKRDSKWRPGGEHKDPRQKYKDAKKAKWSKFKQNIRARSGGKGKKSS